MAWLPCLACLPCLIHTTAYHHIQEQLDLASGGLLVAMSSTQHVIGSSACQHLAEPVLQLRYALKTLAQTTMELVKIITGGKHPMWVANIHNACGLVQ